LICTLELLMICLFAVAEVSYAFNMDL